MSLEGYPKIEVNLSMEEIVDAIWTTKNKSRDRRIKFLGTVILPSTTNLRMVAVEARAAIK